MQAITNIINFVGRNWKFLLILFGLGGTATVITAIPGIPGTENVSNIIGEQINATKAKLGTDEISPTAP